MNRVKWVSLSVTCALALTSISVAGAQSISFMLNGPAYLNGIRSAERTLYGNNDASNHFFDQPGTIIFTTTTDKNPLPSGWNATAGMKFEAYSTFSVSDVNPAVTVVIYDNEDWSQTPKIEQQAPATYTADFASAAHAYGFKFMSTPARDLALVQSDWNGGKLDTYYLGESPYSPSDAFPPWASGPSDYYEIQGQADISSGNISAYLAFCGTAIAEARATNPNAIIFLGISTSYGSENDWLNAIESTQAASFRNSYGPVAGYWLNLSTSQTDEDNIAELLHDLYVAGY